MNDEKRPQGRSAVEWATFLERYSQNKEFCAVQIAEAIDDAIREATGRNGRTLTCNGKTMTIRDWARVAGLPETTIRGRLTKGWSEAEALGFVKRAHHSVRHAVTHNGETLSICEWSRRIGITSQTLKGRIRRGYEAERVLGKKKEYERITYNGQTMTVREWGERKGIRYDVLFHRLRRGWSVEDALNTVPGTRRPGLIAEAETANGSVNRSPDALELAASPLQSRDPT